MSWIQGFTVPTLTALVSWTAADLRSDRADSFALWVCCCADWSARGAEAECRLGFYGDRPLVNSVFSSPCELKHILTVRGHTALSVRQIHTTTHSAGYFTNFNLRKLLFVFAFIFFFFYHKANIWMRHWKVSCNVISNSLCSLYY